MKQIGIIGMGKWGKNLIREFTNFAEISICVTLGNSKNKKWIQKNFPKTKFSTNINSIFENDKIDAVVIATPISTHYSLIKKSLESGKHVFVEKPMTQTIIQANNLIKIAKRNKLNLFVGHVFLHHQIFKKIQKIHKNEFIIHMDFEWKKFGTFDENIFENLLTHDLSINLALFGIPKRTTLFNKSSFITKTDSFNLELFYEKNKRSHISIDRIANYNKKLIKIITKKNLYVWDDDKLFKLDKKSNIFQIFFKSTHSPLFLESKHFISTISKKNLVIDSAILAKNVVSIISKINKTKN